MPIFGAGLTGVFTYTPSPLLMRISLVQNSTTNIHLMRIHSNNANEKHWELAQIHFVRISLMRLFPSPKNRIKREPGVLANTTVLRRD